MATVYFDSSAFVKLVIEEEDTALAKDLWDACDLAVASRLAYPEVRAALAAAGRNRRLTTSAQRRAEAAWDGVWAATRPVELTERLAQQAGSLAGAYALRGADAVHLASALTVGAVSVVVATWDRRMRSGALAAGVQVAPA